MLYRSVFDNLINLAHPPPLGKRSGLSRKNTAKFPLWQKFKKIEFRKSQPMSTQTLPKQTTPACTLARRGICEGGSIHIVRLNVRCGLRLFKRGLVLKLVDFCLTHLQA